MGDEGDLIVSGGSDGFLKVYRVVASPGFADGEWLVHSSHFIITHHSFPRADIVTEIQTIDLRGKFALDIALTFLPGTDCESQPSLVKI